MKTKESENDNVKSKQEDVQGTRHGYLLIMFDLWKDGYIYIYIYIYIIYIYIIKHFIYICAKANSRKRWKTYGNRNLVGQKKKKKRKHFSVCQNPGEGGKQPDLNLVVGSCCKNIRGNQ